MNGVFTGFVAGIFIKYMVIYVGLAQTVREISIYCIFAVYNRV